MWLKGTASGHHDLLDQIQSIVGGNHIDTHSIRNRGTGYVVDETMAVTGGTSSHAPELTVLSITSGNYLSAAVVNAGGTNYVVGDLLYVAGGTFTYQAVCEVTTVSAGVVTGVQINETGVYSVNPTTTGNATTTDSAAGAGCTLDLTMTAGTGIIDNYTLSDAGVYSANPTSPVSTTASASGTGATFAMTFAGSNYVVDMRTTEYEATAAVVSAGGTGYVVNEVLTPGSGVSTLGAEFKVTAVSAGVVTAVSIQEAGKYSTTPSNPLATSSTGSGTGCTLTVTWTATGSSFLIMHNTVQDHYIGIQAAFDSATSAYYFKLEGLTGFGSLTTPWEQQPGYVTAGRAYTPSHNGTINYWMSIKDRSVFVMTKIGTTYPHMWLGLIDITLTDAEYPYPQMVLGNTSTPQPYTYGTHTYAGLPNPGAVNTGYLGPGYLRLPGGVPKGVFNWSTSSGNESYSLLGVGMQPAGQQNNVNAGGADNWYTSSSSFSWNNLVDVDDTDSTTKDKLQRIDSEYIPIPLTLVWNEDRILLGSVPDAYWFDNTSFTLQSEDRLIVDGMSHMVFQNCKKTNRNNMFIIRED